MENKGSIIALVVDQQYNQGVDSAGEPLREYSTNYKRQKAELAAEGYTSGFDHTNFELTGEFQGRMDLTVSGEEYIVDSPATTYNGELKSLWLEKWNGSEIMNLTPENKAVAKEFLEPLFAEKVAAFEG
jgi:hypothetical protein